MPQSWRAVRVGAMSFMGGTGRILTLAAIAAMTLTAGSASATLPGKNGPLLVSASVKEQSLNYSTYLFRQPLAGKPSKLLGKPDVSYSDPAVSPNGRQIVYSRYPGYQLWLGPFSNPLKARAIIPPDPEANNEESLFSPDGKSIYFSTRYFTEAGVGWHLRRYTLKTKQVREYKVNPQLEWGLSDISPNGRLLAYHRGGDDHDSQIRLMDTKTGKSRTLKFRLPVNGGNFSPNGKSIVFTASVKEGWEVFQLGLNGKGEKRLTRGGLINYSPVYSPDGKQIAFTQGAEEYKRIGLITLKTGKTRYIKAPGDYSEVEQWLRK